jgi:nucleoside-diphosphate-sugar epimerase
MRVLILGVNGFIGNALTERILTSTDWEIFGLDMSSDKIEPFLADRRFRFLEGDIAINKEWIEYHIKKCDVVLPLVAIATPASYVRQPIAVFELDFEENLRVIKQAVRYGKRVVFPSTSEVYGMCPDAEFDEETSSFVYGPIHKQRWIYSCSKQLLDRVIWAYGQSHGLRFTLFRPFNWIGPNLDDVDSPKEGSSRVLTQFLHNILYGEPIKLVDGGKQRRSFTYISDGIDGLMRVLANEDKANGGIFNFGNPANDLSIRELAETLRDAVSRYPGYEEIGAGTRIVEVRAAEYYGDGYQDIATRVPSIRRARQILGWEPTIDFDTAVKLTLDFYLTGRKPPVP